MRWRHHLLVGLALVALAIGCSSTPETDASAGASSSVAASSATSSNDDGCSSITSCDTCAKKAACGYCYQTETCQASAGACATWQAHDPTFPYCFGPITCDPRPSAASSGVCDAGSGCYIISSTEGTKCLPSGTVAAGGPCEVGDVTDVCAPGYACHLAGSPDGHCAEVCKIGDADACPAGLSCEQLLGIAHGPFGVCL